MSFWDKYGIKSMIKTKNEEQEYKELKEKINKTIDKTKSKQEYNKKIIKDNNPNTYNQIITKRTNYIGKMDDRIINKYKTLLKNKVKDPKVVDELITSSEITLKERITMKIILEGKDQSNKGMFEIIGVLPEYEQSIKEYFLGKKIHYKEWDKTIQGLKTYLNTQEKNAIKINSIMSITEDLEVTTIKITATFN